MFLFRPLIGTWLLAALVSAVTLATVPRALADQSTSYQIQTDFPNYATEPAGSSTSYQIREGGLTWYETRAQSTSFQIVPPTANTSSAASTLATSSSSSSTAPGQTPGSCRGHQCVPVSGPLPSSSSLSSPASSATGHRSSSSARSSAPGIGQRSSSSLPVRPAAPSVSSPGEIHSSASSSSLPFVMPEGVLPEDLRTFFGATEPICEVRVPERRECPHAAYPEAGTVSSSLLGSLPLFAFALLFLISSLLGGVCILGVLERIDGRSRSASRRMRSRGARKKTARRSSAQPMLAKGLRILPWLAVPLVLWTIFSFLLPRASAATTAPLKHVYNGRLLNASGTPITTAHKIRFSFWKTADFSSGDVTSTGAINTGASTYASWNEVLTVTPDSSGYFSVKLGSGTALPAIDSYSVSTLLSLHLQVEVKSSSAADTSYEVLDPDGGDTSVDRSPVLSVPFALNADRIDQRDLGTGSGSIPVLQSGGLLPVSAVPGGTNRDFFTIDADNSASATITLKFGDTLAKTLTYDITNSRFNFNSSVRIQGNLTVTGSLTVGGLINGINLSTLGSNDKYLKVSSGAGLTVSVNGGSYRVNGTMTNYAGVGSVGITNNVTNYVYLTGTGLQVVAGGSFPTNISFLPLAEVATSGGAITTLTDRRILSSDNREETVQEVLHPAFKDAAFVGSGSVNIGQLSVTQDSSTLRNHYVWTINRSSLQGYDIYLRKRLPSNFLRWTESMHLAYRTSGSSTADNRLDIQVFDTAGNNVTLSGSTSNLASTSWQTTHIEFLGTPTWTPGQDFTIRFKQAARSNAEVHVGTIKLEYMKFNSP